MIIDIESDPVPSGPFWFWTWIRSSGTGIETRASKYSVKNRILLYLSHIHRLGIETVDQLAEDHAVPEEEDEFPGPGPGVEGVTRVTRGDDPPLVQPAQALPPHRLHHRQIFSDDFHS